MLPWRKFRWALYAPFYDICFARLTRHSRAISVAGLRLKPGDRVLVAGCGTGLDFRHLPKGVVLTAVDFSEPMVARARGAAQKAGFAQGCVQLGSATRLPFADVVFDAVVLHLILAVVSDPAAACQEAFRVLKPGGMVTVFDKGLPDGRPPGRFRLFLNKFTAPIATEINLPLPQLLQDAGFSIHSIRSTVAGFFMVVLAEKA